MFIDHLDLHARAGNCSYSSNHTSLHLSDVYVGAVLYEDDTRQTSCYEFFAKIYLSLEREEGGECLHGKFVRKPNVSRRGNVAKNNLRSYSYVI